MPRLQVWARMRAGVQSAVSPFFSLLNPHLRSGPFPPVLEGKSFFWALPWQNKIIPILESRWMGPFLSAFFADCLAPLCFSLEPSFVVCIFLPCAYILVFCFY